MSKSILQLAQEAEEKADPFPYLTIRNWREESMAGLVMMEKGRTQAQAYRWVKQTLNMEDSDRMFYRTFTKAVNQYKAQKES